MADGSVVIDTKMDTSGVEKGADDITQSLESILGNLQNISSSVNKIVGGLTGGSNAASKAVSNLTDNLEATAEAGKRAVKEVSKFDPSDVSGITIHRWNDDSNLIGDTSEISDQQRQELAENAKAAKEAAQEEAEAFNGAKEKVNELYEAIKKTKEELKSLEKSGQWWGDDEYDQAAIKLNELNNQAKEYKKITLPPEIDSTADSVSRLGEKVDSLSKKLMAAGIDGLKNKIKSIGKTIDGLVSKLLKLTSSAIIGGLQRISSGIFAIHKSANKSTLSLKNLLKYAFGIRSLFVLFNKLRSAIVTGFQNLAKYDLATQTGEVNNSISALMSALTRLKNSFATAFAPILTTVAPILVSFINLISEAVTRVGMLIAALTGKDSFTKAIGIQENYAASLDKSASSANKAKKATKGYLSSLDEIKRYDDGKDNSNTGSTGKYTGPSPKDMFEEVPIESSLKGIADKIKELIQNEDWEGLGVYIADGINKGLQKIYAVINWDNVGPKVTKFITAFTTTFNSLVDHINWNLMGRTLGAGVNTLVNSLNLLIGNDGIDFNKIGESIAKGLRGAIREINWTSLGELLGNKFMISWRMLSGFVNEMSRKNDAGITGWTELGKAVGKAMTGTFSKISFTDIAKALVGVINGAFETLAGFDNEFDWKSFQENLKSGIQTMVNDIDWKENGAALGSFIKHLIDALNQSITASTFIKFGKKIGDFLAQLPWGTILFTAAKVIVLTIVSGIISFFTSWNENGLGENIGLFIVKALAAVKLATLFPPIKTLVGWIIGKIAARMVATESTAAISEGLGNMLSTALSGAATSAGNLAAALGPLVGTAGLIIAVGGAATVATSELAGFVETMQGGNGIGSTFGNTMNNFIQTLQQRGDIISGSAEEIWQLKESLEQEGMTAEDKASATQKLIDKLGEMGVTSDQAEQAFSTLYQQGLITDDMFDILSESIKTLDNNTTNMAGSIDLSKQSLDDLYDNVLPQLQTQLGLSADEMVQLDTALLETENSGGTAQDAFNKIMERAQELGINTESVAKIFAEVFPDAVRETESSTKTSMENTKKSVETGMGAASVAAGAAMAGIQKSTEDSMSAAEKAVSDSTSNISSDSDTNWKAAEGFATGSVGNIGQTAYDKMKEVYGVISRYNSSIKDDFDTKWGKSKDLMVKAIEKMASTTQSNSQIIFDGVKNVFNQIPGYIRDVMNDAVGKVNSTVSRINSTLGDIERGFTFSYNVQLPNGGRRWGNYSMSLPRVSNIPYLASGAVIPPRSEFLAVLGDQKNGRNLEAPEDLLRQIVREEAGGNQSNGGNFRFTVQLNRRTIFDEMIDEAKLRRDASGVNPFELA